MKKLREEVEFFYVLFVQCFFKYFLLNLKLYVLSDVYAQKIDMNKKILLIIIISAYIPLPSYAQEQDIAESFGLYSKGLEYYHKGNLYEAQETLEQAVRLDSRNDEAEGYLDLVNAEIKMRGQGRLNSYQDANSLKRETDLGNKEQY
jgi:tetratricopeptide (TPR) repeat protein